MARMCIITRKEVPRASGTPIREDSIIQAIRAIKGRLGILQNNELVVSNEALEEYKKKRAKFEKTAVIYTTLAAIFVVVFIFGPLFLGAPFNIMGVFFAILVGVLFAGLSLLSYIPALDDGKESTVPTPSQIVSRLMPRALSKEGGSAASKAARKTAPKKPAPKAQAKPAPKKAYRRKKRK